MHSPGRISRFAELYLVGMIRWLHLLGSARLKLHQPAYHPFQRSEDASHSTYVLTGLCPTAPILVTAPTKVAQAVGRRQRTRRPQTATPQELRALRSTRPELPRLQGDSQSCRSHGEYFYAIPSGRSDCWVLGLRLPESMLMRSLTARCAVHTTCR